MTVKCIKELPSVPLTNLRDLPNKAGLYFAVNDIEEIYYIGQTQNFKRRWGNHHRYKDLSLLDNIRIAYMEYINDDLDEAEKALIRKYKPKFNRVDREIKEPESNRSFTITDKKKDVIMLLTDQTSFNLAMAKVVDFYIENNIEKFIRGKEERARFEENFNSVIDKYTAHSSNNQEEV